MIDPLLFEKKVVPIDVIKRKVSQAVCIDLKFINMTNKIPTARKREFVVARQISMKLAKKYTTLSLATIGFHHGGRDHATVLHACKTVDELIDTKDQDMLEKFYEAEDLIRKWRTTTNRKFSAMRIEDKIKLVKLWIKAKVPLEIRQRKLIDFHKKCPYCGKVMTIKTMFK